MADILQQIKSGTFKSTRPTTTRPKSIVAMPTSKDLGTSQGLYGAAVNAGLQERADKMLSQKGEDVNKIFSGGFISDIFDVLNAVQYGVVGVLKGKGFAEGVKTRQSFSDQDSLGESGLPGVIGGILLDIAVDPLTYIAPWTVIKKIKPLMKAGKAVKSAAFGRFVEKTVKVAGKTKKVRVLEDGTKAGKYLGEKFKWMFGVDPVYKETWNRGLRGIGRAQENIAKLAEPFSKITPKAASHLLKVDKTGRFIREDISKLKKLLSPEDFKKTEVVWNKIDELGKEAVDLKLLSKAKFEENFGEYIKNSYLEFEKKGKKFLGGSKIGVKGIKKRVKGLTPEKMKELGQIDNPSFLAFKSMFDITKDIENTKLFNLMAKTLGSDTAQIGFKQIPKGVKFGKLSGKYVPEHMAKYINEIYEPIKRGVNKKIVAGFKFGKVIMNPATHARNIASNQLLNWWKLGMNPLDPRTIKAQATAIKQMRKGGKFLDEARTAGYNLNTFASQELKNILLGPEFKGFQKGWKKSAKKLGDLYQGEENFAKLTAFIFQRNKGVGIEEAWKAAEAATFNYAQVTPFIRKVRENIWGMPFITFTAKATPLALKTAFKAPTRISNIGKIKRGIENLSDIKTTARERAAEPDWIRDGFYIKLPWKDKHKRSAYFDLSYIIPFGDLVSGNFFEQATIRETGLPEGVPSAAMRKLPAIALIRELGRNQDFFGDKIWKDSDTDEKKLGDVFRHISKMYLPPLISDQIPGGYKTDGTRRQKGFIGALQPKDKISSQRTLIQEMLRNVGAKIQPIQVDIQESYMESEKKKALRTLLEEAGVTREFRRPYIPKSPYIPIK